MQCSMRIWSAADNGGPGKLDGQRAQCARPIR
jgi:hypothetical protein